jgi:exopolyphosphatase/guanosine-5'-triphosphate,3'-diphosphate pyrophosphatase
VLLHRAHDSDPIPQLDLSADGNRLQLVVSRTWLANRPLLRADLLMEKEGMPGLGIEFQPMVA